MSRRMAIVPLVLSLALFMSSAAAFAQCPGSWDPSFGVPGANATVHALLTLPNGDLIAGGDFTSIGGVAASGIARWNGSGWSPVGAGLNGAVRALALMPSGEFIAGGIFTLPGGLNIARWNGAEWVPMGTGLSPGVSCLLVLPDGHIVAGGSFAQVLGSPWNRIARWDGQTWSGMGTGMSSAVTTLSLLPDGSIVAGGLFSTAGGVAAAHVARWDGSAWSALGSGLPGDVFALGTAPNGDLVAGGMFNILNVTAYTSVAHWNGTDWLPMGTFSPWSFALATLPSGDLIVGGRPSSLGPPIARWDGTNWAALQVGTLNDDTLALAGLPNGDLAVGGAFSDTLGGTRIGRYRFVSPPPVFRQQPRPAVGCVGRGVVFPAWATGVGIISYQLQLEVAADTWATLGVSPITLPCGGSARVNGGGTVYVTPCSAIDLYRVRVLATSGCGSTASEPTTLIINTADFDNDGDVGTDADIEAFFRCLAGDCCPTCGPADFNGDHEPGDHGRMLDIVDFFQALATGGCVNR